jgi:hypothetical protein
VKKVFSLFFGIIALFVTTDLALAQDSGGQDSTGLASPALRPRRDTYIIETYPSPARHGQTIKIQFYNHFPGQVISLNVIDILGRVIKELQPQAAMPAGIHSYDFNTSLYSSASYHIRLTTFTSTGAEDAVQDSRFIVVH